MKTFFLSTTCLFVFQIAFAQTPSWQGTCCDNNGKPLSPNLYSEVYSVKKFQTNTPVEINIKSVVIGSQTVSVDLKYKDKIEGDTKIISLNDTIGIKLVIGKAVENGVQKYLYKLDVFKKDKKSNCWRNLTMAYSFSDVYAQTVLLGQFAYGAPNTKDYVQIVEGWIKFD